MGHAMTQECPFFGLPTGWAGLPLEIFPIPVEAQSSPAYLASAKLLMALRGRGAGWVSFEERTLAPLGTGL